METLIKRVLYSSVGLVANTSEKVQKTVNTIMDKDTDAQKQGKKIIDGLFKKTEDRKEVVEDKMKDTFGDLLGKFDLVTQSDYDELLEKVEKLEAEVKGNVKITRKTTAKKAAPKKTTAKIKTTAKKVTRKVAVKKVAPKKTTAKRKTTRTAKKRVAKK